MTDEEPDIARIAALLGEPARSAICLALCGGRPAAAGELAQRAGVSAQTASNHLAKLVGGRLVTVEAVGRNRFYRLANTDVARVLEALLVVAPPRSQHTRPPRERRSDSLAPATTTWRAGWRWSWWTRCGAAAGCGV